MEVAHECRVVTADCLGHLGSGRRDYFALPEEFRRLRTTLNIGAAVVKVLLVTLMVRRVAAGHEDIFSFKSLGA